MVCANPVFIACWQISSILGRTKLRTSTPWGVVRDWLSLLDNQLLLILLEAESSGNPVSVLLSLRPSTDKYCVGVVCLCVPVLGCNRVGSQDSAAGVSLLLCLYHCRGCVIVVPCRACGSRLKSLQTEWDSVALVLHRGKELRLRWCWHLAEPPWLHLPRLLGKAGARWA